MVNTSDMITDFDRVLSEVGAPLIVKFYACSGITTTGSEYDDVSYVAWQQSGANVSGVAVIQPLSRDTAGVDYKFMQEGIIRFDDRKIFVTGSLLDYQPSNSKIRFYIGAKTWELLPAGMQPHTASGVTIFYTGYIREY